MSFSDDQVKALSAPLHSAHVKSRFRPGRNLSYIEAWWAIAEANRIFGYDGWTRETVELVQLGEPRLVGDKYRVGYRAKVRITVYAEARWSSHRVIREGCGFGSGIDKDVDQAHESALKEAESDAMKRALMTFGNPFGLALYDKTQAHVGDGLPREGPG
jgi:DNA repair and recombination protein RAD52